jgi:DNA polymerase III epsilon subunit-like protein
LPPCDTLRRHHENNTFSPANIRFHTMRQIVLDTETTGLSAANGDRQPTSSHLHCYINPERDKPKFSEVAPANKKRPTRNKPYAPVPNRHPLSFTSN